MNLFVVDSSVVIKWFVPETDTDVALRLQSGHPPLHSPDFLDVELAAIAWKKIRRDGMTRADADFIVSKLPVLPIQKHPAIQLVHAAFDLADRTNRSVYDCLYLALAVQLDGVMVTADEKLANALSTTVWSMHIIKLQNIP